MPNIHPAVQQHQRRHEAKRPGDAKGVEKSKAVLLGPIGRRRREEAEHETQEDGVKEGNGEIVKCMAPSALWLAENGTPRFANPEQGQQQDRRRSLGEGEGFPWENR